MGKITARDLKRHLAQRSREELVADLLVLFDKFGGVRDYYEARLGGGDGEVLARYRAVIEREFFPPERRLPRARLSIARKAVTDFKKVATSPADVAALMVYYVETGVRFTQTYGDIDEAFYNSMESMFESAAQLILKADLEDRFIERCRSIVGATADMGWGFHDRLSELFEQYFGE